MALAGNQHGVGNSGGKSLNDRKLAASVRTLTLKKIQTILEGEDNDYQRQIILKLAGTVLPRLNEHTGEDGDKLTIQVISYENSNSSQLPTKRLSVGVPESETEIQDSSDPSPRGEEQDGTERSDTQITNY